MAGTQAALKARAGQKGHRTILQRDGRLLGVDGEQSALVADLALAAEPQRGNARVRDGERRSISPQHAQGVWESAAEAVARYLISEIRLPLYGICAIAAGAGVGYPRSLSGRGAGSGMSLMRRQGKVVHQENVHRISANGISAHSTQISDCLSVSQLRTIRPCHSRTIIVFW